jgi:ribosomal-protein-alanine N-acetyltransferase
VGGQEIRAAGRADLDGLVALEDASFPGDRLTRRNFRHAIASPSILVLIAPGPDGLRGSALVEFRKGARVARLSSIAVAARAAGSGLGRRLMDEAEAECWRRGCDRLRLEVRADNRRAIDLYLRNGYREVGRSEDYYEDGEAALRFEKSLADGRA